MRAAARGVSMEEKARQIIYQTVSAPEQISQVFRKYFGPENGINLDILNQRKQHQPVDFK
jgi:plasmid stability protein